jgi:hypothetical protein
MIRSGSVRQVVRIENDVDRKRVIGSEKEEG